MLLLPPDSRLSATCNWNQPSIGVENKSAINLHCPCERLSFPPPPSAFHQWHHISDVGRHKDCTCFTRIRAELQSDPPRLGHARAVSFSTRLNSVNEIVAQSRTTTKTILWYLTLIWKRRACTHDGFSPTIPRNPWKHTPSAEERGPVCSH